MAKKEIIWTQRALNNFNHTILYIHNNWGENVASSFVEKTYSIIDVISDYPHIGSVENVEKMIRGFVITKQNRLFYRDESNKIFIYKFLIHDKTSPKRNID